MMTTAVRADLVLVGGGHTHVQILRRWMMRPVDGVRVTVVVDRPDAVYSGMVPGFVAGDYAAHDLEIDLVPLARRAGARVVLAPAIDIDPVAHRVVLDGRPSIAYDVASLDVGATVRGLDLPGVREHALSTRPIRDFVDRVENRIAAAAAAVRGAFRVAVVGGGAAGVELAFTLRARLLARGATPQVSVFSDTPEVLAGYAEGVVSRARAEAERRGIAFRVGEHVAAVEHDAVVLESGRAPCDLVVWATGAEPLRFPACGSLARDAQGFVRVRRTLQVLAHDDLFAVGDCASIEDAPWVRKAGVYAVREGPVLDFNLRAVLARRPPRAYRPQRDFLAILNLGERRALASKWGVVVVGKSMWHLKDRIDRRFMRRFQVLTATGAPAPTFPSTEGMVGDEMTCGGCAAKVAAPVLERALARLPPPPADSSVLVGIAEADDAAAVRLGGGEVSLATVDAFRAFADDPWLVGRVAAVNAVSDIFAKGGRPRHALAFVTIADEDQARAEETLYQVLAGVRAALDPLSVSLIGGHTTSGPELFVGLSVTGDLPNDGSLVGLDGASPGDALILTKPLGTGVVLAADMRGRAPGRVVMAAIASMARSNAEAGRIVGELGVRACTDVSGFGLVGHLAHIVRASGVSAEVALDALPVLPGARELLTAGIRSSFHPQTVSMKRELDVDSEIANEPALDLLFDPQTSGGLLFSIAGTKVRDACRMLGAASLTDAAVIGRIDERRDGAPSIRVVPQLRHGILEEGSTAVKSRSRAS